MRAIYYQLTIAVLLLLLVAIGSYSIYRLSVKEDQIELLNSKLSGLQDSYLKLYLEKERRTQQKYAFVAAETTEKNIMIGEAPIRSRIHLSSVLTIEGEEGQYQAKDRFTSELGLTGIDVRVTKSKIYVFGSYREASEYREKVYQAGRIID